MIKITMVKSRSTEILQQIKKIFTFIPVVFYTYIAIVFLDFIE